MKLYRLFLGHNIRVGNNPSRLQVSELDMSVFLDNVVSKLFPGFTRIEAKGYWESSIERTTVVEIMTSPESELKIVDIAEQYKAEFNQDAVLVQRLDVNETLI